MALSNATGIWDAAALSGTANYCAGVQGQVRIDAPDRHVLRSLATRVAELADRASEEEKRALWRMHNDLEPTRALVFCDPENGWNEILPESGLRCIGPLARRWEMVLLKEIFWAEGMKDDKVIEPHFDVGYTRSEDDWGLQARLHGGAGGSYVWEPAIRNEADIDRIHAPVFEIDHETTRQSLETARQVFDGLLEVRLAGVWWWSLGMTLDLALLRGLEGIMLDMVDRPELVHRLMASLRDGYLQKIDYLETNGLLSLNTERYVGSGGFGYTRQLPASVPDGRVRTCQMWGFSESQETVGISPEMFAEFIFPYQLPLLERFGLNCYGCCEPLNTRWQVVKRIPNLRRVSVSAWADLGKMSAMLEDRYIFSFKPNPADLAVPRLNEEAIRTQIRRVLELARGCRLELLMKDNHTLGGNPQNAVRWVQIAREESERAKP